MITFTITTNVTDLNNLLLEKLKKAEGHEKETIAQILNTIFDAVDGGDKFLWNGHTNINVDSNFVFLLSNIITQLLPHNIYLLLIHLI